MACVFIEHRRVLRLRRPEKRLKETDLPWAEALRTVCILLCMAAAFVKVDGASDGAFEVCELRNHCKRLGAAEPNSDLLKALRSRSSRALVIADEDSVRLVRLATDRDGPSVVLSKVAYKQCDKALTKFASLI